MDIVLKDDVLKPPRRGRNNKYPWDLMQIGQSFVVEIERRKSIISNIYYLNRTRRYGNKRFDWACVTENGREFIRVWREKDAGPNEMDSAARREDDRVIKIELLSTRYCR